VNKLPKVVIRQYPGAECASELPQDYKSDTLPLDYRTTRSQNRPKITKTRFFNVKVVYVMLVHYLDSSAVLVAISSKSLSIRNCFYAKLVDSSRNRKF